MRSSTRQTPEYRARLAEAKAMPHAALLAWVRAHGYTDADGVNAWSETMLRRAFARDIRPAIVTFAGVEVVEVGKR